MCVDFGWVEENTQKAICVHSQSKVCCNGTGEVRQQAVLQPVTCQAAMRWGHSSFGFYGHGDYTDDVHAVQVARQQIEAKWSKSGAAGRQGSMSRHSEVSFHQRYAATISVSLQYGSPVSLWVLFICLLCVLLLFLLLSLFFQKLSSHKAALHLLPSTISTTGQSENPCSWAAATSCTNVNSPYLEALLRSTICYWNTEHQKGTIKSSTLFRQWERLRNGLTILCSDFTRRKCQETVKNRVKATCSSP